MSVPGSPRLLLGIQKDQEWAGVGAQRTVVFAQAFATAFIFLGGCGAMYEIHIESEDFREKRTVQQHQMVNQVRGVQGGPWRGW